MAKLLRAIASIIGVFLLLTILAVAGLVGAALYRPQWIINDRTILIAASYAATHGVALKWATLSADVQSPSLLVKVINIRGDGICWANASSEEARDKKEDAQLRICTESASLSATVNFNSFPPKLDVLGPVAVKSGSLDFQASTKKAKPTPESEEENGGPFQLPSPLARTSIRDIDIDFDTIRVKLPEKTVRGGARLKADGNEGSLRLNGRSESLSIDGRIQAQYDGRSRIHTSLNLDVLNLIPELKKISINDCTIDLDRLGETESGVKTNCPIRFSVPVPPREFSRFKIPAQAGVRVLADLRSSAYPPSPQARVQGTVEAQLDPILAPLFRGEGNVHSTLDGVPSRFPDKWTLSTKLGIKVEVPSFQKAVAELRSTPWAIPAPFQALGGKISLAAQGEFERESGTIPLVFNTDLASKSQRMKVDATGKIGLPADEQAPVDVGLDVVLSDVQLELPRLDLAKPPTIFPDPRIAKKTEKKPSKGRQVHTVITVRTPPAQPVRLLSNLAQEPVPVALSFRSETGKPNEGSVSVKNFPLELFRRDARVDHLDLTLAEPSDKSPINGKINFKYTDYTMQMLLLGTVGKPQMILESDPPLPQEQLMSALLFGEPLESLDPDKLSSVGNAQAAIADGVLNLASLYALASTPIQSVGYNPQTGVATMKLRIAEGTSLNIGASSSTYQEIGVRKRIGPNWTVSTQVENDASTSEKTVSAYLEWAMRY